MLTMEGESALVILRWAVNGDIGIDDGDGEGGSR